MSSKVWDKFTYPFPNFNGATVEVWEYISNFIPHYMMDIATYPCWEIIKLNHDSERGHWWLQVKFKVWILDVL